MRGVKDELKDLDGMFLQEEENPQMLDFITEIYRTVETHFPMIAELARRRYRQREHRLKTCREMFISESNYYRMLGFFLLFARKELEQ